MSWGIRLGGFEEMLGRIKDAGYLGVEFSQHPKELGEVSQLIQTLKRVGLDCIGMAGGALDERVKFVEKYASLARELLLQKAKRRTSKRRHRAQERTPTMVEPYVYVDEWDEEPLRQALNAGLPLTIHPHMFKQIQTAADAEALLDTESRLQFLPDTAHLTIAGEDVVDVIARNFGRINAVHLKDWTPEFGRAYQFYARGFVELGKGDVRLEDVLRYLKQRSFHGWVVVEQNFAADPFESALASREWLRAQGV